MRLLIFLILPFASFGQWAPARPLGYSETHRQLSDIVSNFNRRAYGSGNYEAPTPPVAAPLPQEYYQRSTTPNSPYKLAESNPRTFPAQVCLQQKYRFYLQDFCSSINTLLLKPHPFMTSIQASRMGVQSLSTTNMSPQLNGQTIYTKPLLHSTFLRASPIISLRIPEQISLSSLSAQHTSTVVNLIMSNLRDLMVLPVTAVISLPVRQHPILTVSSI